MIRYEEAFEIIKSQAFSPDAEVISMENSLHRVLAEDIYAPFDIPPFTKSGMDGYACGEGDESTRLRILETIPAGSLPRLRVNPGECARIMTGAMVPEGAGRVIRREFTNEADGFIHILRDDPKRNVLSRGEDLHQGDLALPRGFRIGRAQIAFLASLGIASFSVFHRPRIGVIITGSELLRPGQPPEKGKIYDSNSFSLAAQISETGAILAARDTVEDDPEQISDRVSRLLDQVDLLILSGGVSAGDFDYVPDVLKKLGISVLFEKVAVQPGMPTLFGRIGEKSVFGLPGNPVSTFIIFEVFIKPVIYAMSGTAWEPRTVSGTLRETFRRKHSERTLFQPARHETEGITPIPTHGSAHLHALTKADCLITIPAGIEEIPAGQTIHARLL